MTDGKQFVLCGNLESITSSGYVVGWAYDSDATLRPLIVSARVGADEVAIGIANNYRHDLAEVGRGAGWCGFRIKLAKITGQHLRCRVSLWSLTNQAEICQTDNLPLTVDHELDLLTLANVVSSDPTMIHSIGQLSSCSQVFSRFIGSNGSAAFVSAAYWYIFGRQADASDLANYSIMVEAGTITPYELLKALYESDEFQLEPRLLPAPIEPAFVFRGSGWY